MSFLQKTYGLIIHMIVNLPSSIISLQNKLSLVSERERIQLVDIVFGTPDGKYLRGITIPVENLKSSLENGQAFDGSSIDGYSGVTFSDLLLKSVLNSFLYKGAE